MENDLPPVLSTLPPAGQVARVLPILRDVGIIFALTFIGGLIIGLANPSPASLASAIAAANFMLCTVGFCISGCLAVGNRWRHLLWVALGLWLGSFINVAFFGLSFALWIISSMPILIFMGLGGALSYLFRRP